MRKPDRLPSCSQCRSQNGLEGMGLSIFQGPIYTGKQIVQVAVNAGVKQQIPLAIQGKKR